jgi:hypothetical protein
MSNKFQMQGAMIAEEMKFLAIAAIRESVTAGLEFAVSSTHNDSSNAAVHWQVGITNASGGSRRPASTKLGKGPLDFRPRKQGGSPKDSLDGSEKHVTYRGSNRIFTPPAVLAAVLEREINSAISKISGSQAPTSIYFFNSVGNVGPYAKAINLEIVGEVAIIETLKAFDYYMKNPTIKLDGRNVRRRLGRKL